MLCVTVIDESKKSLHVNKLGGFNSYHNLHYNNHGVRVWKCYDIGRKKVYDYDDIFVERQAPTMMQAQEPNLGFRDPLLQKRILKAKTQEASKTDDCEEASLFECSVSACTKAFHSFSDLELLQDIGNHTKSSQYDIIRRDWGKKFRTVDLFSAEKAAPNQTRSVQCESKATQAKAGWALSKPHCTKRFSASVKEYLTTRFVIGERTGRKADAAQVAIDMRTARDALNARIFHREDWLTKSQIQGFFSRFAAARRKEQGTVVGLSPDSEEDVECNEEHADRQELIDLVNNEIKVAHPIYYDVYDLCECYRTDTLSKFSKTVLKSICLHFEILFKSADLKQTLVAKIAEIISECECVAN
jgi:Arf-GAP/Rho-GAP domain/ANK repeat/PH domain-containing protein 3